MFRAATRRLRSLAVAAALAAVATTTAEATTLGTPYGMAVDLAGDLYVANAQANNVTVYDRSGTLLRTISAGMNVPMAVAVGLNIVYVANAAGNNITRYSPIDGSQVNGTITAPNLTNPVQLLLDPVNTLWVVTSGGDLYSYFVVEGAVARLSGLGIRSIGMAAGNLLLAGLPSTVAGDSQIQAVYVPPILEHNATGSVYANDIPDRSPDGVAGDPAGNFWVTDPLHKRILKTTLYGSQSLVSIKLSYAPKCIALDVANRRFYVSDPLGNKVHVYSLAAPYAEIGSIQ